jgi:hypothetical protein
VSGPHERVICLGCGRLIPLRKDGVPIAHRAPDGWRWCPGTNIDPFSGLRRQ